MAGIENILVDLEVDVKDIQSISLNGDGTRVAIGIPEYPKSNIEKSTRTRTNTFPQHVGNVPAWRERSRSCW